VSIRQLFTARQSLRLRKGWVVKVDSIGSYSADCTLDRWFVRIVRDRDPFDAETGQSTPQLAKIRTASLTEFFLQKQDHRDAYVIQLQINVETFIEKSPPARTYVFVLAQRTIPRNRRNTSPQPRRVVGYSDAGVCRKSGSLHAPVPEKISRDEGSERSKLSQASNKN